MTSDIPQVLLFDIGGVCVRFQKPFLNSSADAI